MHNFIHQARLSEETDASTLNFFRILIGVTYTQECYTRKGLVCTCGSFFQEKKLVQESVTHAQEM